MREKKTHTLHFFVLHFFVITFFCNNFAPSSNSTHMKTEFYTIHDFRLASEAKSLIQSAKLYERDQYILTLLDAAEDKLFEYLTIDKLVVDLKD